ncbi:hypothetical protein BBO99_00005481 [Phytophthora kernoviae]|uniref:Kazal-like domain-containing protein n=1 Tax=Phytophthora kernoviae TaxID=325452 RepID=A0A421GNI1_9STRA|nr:hypothetical protein BBI17_005563 [Phytophthora kernoviae]RLN79139.1 hypothetical protein BBO99_00005481 [Phytophthora kernoviae]
MENPLFKAISPDFADWVLKADKLKPIADELGVSMAELAIAWCVSNENVSTVLVGAKTLMQLEQNLKALGAVELITSDIAIAQRNTASHPSYPFGDDVTYINDCHLLSSKCEHPELEKASHGACKENPEANTGFQTLAIDEDTDIGDPREASTPAPEKCNPMCERVYDPICGSDGITYANKCLLEYAACRNPSVRAFGEGKCPPHMQAIRGVSNPSSNNNNNDGQTHDNLCLFANARCEHPQHTLTVVHDGECNADTELTCETMTCPTFSECREQKEADDLVISYCADVCSPDRCSEREDCELVDSDCYTAPCSPIAMCIPKVQDD